MFDHVTIRVSDRGASERFYDTVLSTIGIEAGHRDGELAEWGDFSIAGDGPRPQYVEDYYGAFLLDPDGHNVEVVNHRR